MTLRPLQTWFEKMSSRERGMLLIFAIGAVFLWGSLLFHQGRALQADVAAKNAKLRQQQQSLDQQPKVNKDIAYYKDKFKTSVALQDLVNKVQAYTRTAEMPTPGITTSHNDAKKDSIFNVNSVTVHFVRTPIRNLVNFTTLVEADKPYLVIDELQITPERTDPRLLSGDIQIWALELKPNALDVSAPATPVTAVSSAVK